ncbi:DNA RNA helicase and DSH domain containing protein [Aphelenchoides fujianensis]|nr:DNA RNA helicase and DSH domain containing protein [Aphelenchoides fujianensis]
MTAAVEEAIDLDDLLSSVQEEGRKASELLNGDAAAPPLISHTNGAANGEDEDVGREAEVLEEVSRAVRVDTLLKHENCIHEVAVPAGLEYVRPDPEAVITPAKTYPFTLDRFQSQAIACIDQSQSVLVSAHTSAGKTVVAEYAIATALRDKQRVIYTSPIKALSNQKFRELAEEFNDVGLMTGDVTLNPSASCLVMTTEILRSMLYRGSEIMREVGWVVFDEIHYMRDEERGVVWEETIILLPHNVHYVFLSATIPNAKQFASWIACLHHQICHIVYTDYRPTPLQHVFYSSGSNGLYEVVSATGEFREDQFNRAMSFVAEDGAEKEQTRQGRQQAMQVNANNVTVLVRTIRERELLPCIVFSFSRRECEAYAQSLKDMDFNDGEQKNTIEEIYRNAVALLNEEDQKLSQIKWILPFLKRGIGIHHSGLLPLLKECIEILFGEGLLKILFATETFAMGLNMPARTVLFTSARKFDGRNNRWISSGEYIQMSGRAGRRGLDAQGLVILMVDQKMSADVAKNIIKGHTDPLNSQFRLTYNMVLNLIRVPEINPQYMMERSFKYFQNKMLLPPLYEKLAKLKKERDAQQVPYEEEVQALNQLKVLADGIREKIRSIVLQPKHLSPYFHAGRLFRVKTAEADLGWGALIDVKKTQNKMNETVHVLEMALRLHADTAREIGDVNKLRPPAAGDRALVRFVPVDLQCISAVSSVRVKLPDQPENSDKCRDAIGLTMKRTMERFKDDVPELDPVKDMGIENRDLKTSLEQWAKMESEIKNHPLRKREDFQDIYATYERKAELHKQVKAVQAEIQKIKHGQFNEELEARQRVLRRIQYVDSAGQITSKGRIACEISAADEIVLTEMLLSGVFNEMSKEDAAALLSCFVFEEKVSKMPTLDDRLTSALNTLQTHARKVAKVCIECKLDLIEEQYLQKFQSGLMPVVKQWVQGSSFQQVCDQNKDIFEGSIIRCLRRLEELLREMKSAVKAMGNEALCEVFEEASKHLKRDIVFAASLYL